MAARWMDALRGGNQAQLQELSALPFELREPAQYANCKSATVKTRQQLPAAVACLLDDELLMDELASQPEPLAEVVSRVALPAWAASLRGAHAPLGKAVRIQLPGNGVSYEFVLVVTEAGVAGVWKHAEFEPN